MMGLVVWLCHHGFPCGKELPGIPWALPRQEAEAVPLRVLPLMRFAQLTVYFRCPFAILLEKFAVPNSLHEKWSELYTDLKYCIRMTSYAS